MNYINAYQKKYPDDQLVVTGGAGDALHLSSSTGEKIYIKDIDVEVKTNTDGHEQLRRWKSVLPDSYQPRHDDYLEIITWIDTTGKDLSIDVFINQEDIADTVSIDGFLVRSLDSILDNYKINIPGMKYDIEYMKSQDVSFRLEDELRNTREKYDRYCERYEKLLKIVK